MARALSIGFRPIGRGVSQLREQFRPGLKILMASAIFLLVIVGTNGDAFVLAQSEERRRETAIRLALGANTWQLATGKLLEILPVAVAGGALGIGLALATGPQLLRFFPVMREGIAYLPVNPPPWLGVDARIAFFALASTSGIALVVTTATALVSRRLNTASELKLQPLVVFGKGVPARAVLTSIQVAITTVLLTGSMLLLRTYRALEASDPGFDRADVVLFTVAPKVAGYQNAQLKSLYSGIEQTVERLPGIRVAAWAELGLMRGTGMKATVSQFGVASPRAFMNTSLNSVSPGYFDVMGMYLVKGRDLRDDDAANPDHKRVVVNEAFARMLFGSGDPVGKTFVLGNHGSGRPVFEIAGVVSDARFRSLREERPPTFYGLPAWTIDNDGIMILHVAAFGRPRAVIDEARTAIERIAPNVPVTEVSTMEQEVENSLWQERLILVLVQFFAVAALLLAALGLYAGVRQSGLRRRREFGIRRAVGARALHIAEALCGAEMPPVIAGIAIGLCGAWMAARIAGSFLYGVSGLDAVSYLAGAGFLTVTVMAALCVPLVRALRVDPATALREE